MLVDEINKLKEELNKQVENSSLDNEIILAISQDLDKLILEYYRDVLRVQNTCSNVL
ncbi:MAG: Spo0E like sporulation regulatory protein [Eubacterium sp.]|nr:Spo0E like sporulation regulatory protein [Eubacterium sp.]